MKTFTMQDGKGTMSRKLVALFHRHKSQRGNLKAGGLGLIQQEHSAVFNVCVCAGAGPAWLTWLLNAPPHLSVAFHDYSVSAALKDASLDEMFA